MTKGIYSLTTLLLFLMSCELQAQVGFSAAYFNQQIPEWETAVLGNTSNDRLLATGYKAGVDIWIKPFKELRIELFPEIALSSATSERMNNNFLESFKLSTVGFNLNMNFYILNFKSDCDCPTFSKQESFFEKGLFIQLSPGFHYLDGSYNSADSLISKMNDWVPQLGIGMGLDIGISDFITITPIIKYNRFFNATWDGLLRTTTDPVDSNVEGGDNSSINRFSAGIHIGIRWRE